MAEQTEENLQNIVRAVVANLYNLPVVSCSCALRPYPAFTSGLRASVSSFISVSFRVQVLEFSTSFRVHVLIVRYYELHFRNFCLNVLRDLNFVICTFDFNLCNFNFVFGDYSY